MNFTKGLVPFRNDFAADTLDRKIEFEKPLSDLRGRNISIDFEMRDCEIFSMKIL